MEDLISVIINVYNEEKYIAKCLESIINQTYKNLEIIIVNDGSTDNTLKICQSYKDKRIKIINQNNMGLSLSRNVGIENSNGKYLYFVDSDDFVENDVIEYLYGMIKKNNVKISTCNPIEIYNYKFKVKNKKEKIEIISSEEMLKKILLSQNCTTNTWNKLISRELFNNIRFENRIINDLACTYKLILATDKIAYSNQIKYYYLKHNESITSKAKKNKERSIDIYNVSLERYNYIKKIYPNMHENEIYIADAIMKLYLFDNSEVQEFLKKKCALDMFKKMFSIEILFYKLKVKEKLKLILFRINPRLCMVVKRSYLNIKSKIKNIFKIENK